MPTAHYESKIYPVTDEPLAPKGCVAKQHLLRVCTHPPRAMVGQSLNYPLSDCVALRFGTSRSRRICKQCHRLLLKDVSAEPPYCGATCIADEIRLHHITSNACFSLHGHNSVHQQNHKAPAGDWRESLPTSAPRQFGRHRV